MSLIKVMGGTQILCPNTLPPYHEAHQRRTSLLNEFYKAGEKDADGDLIPAVSAAYEAANTHFDGAWMRLYHDQVTPIVDGRQMVVDSWWWRCHVCGLTLPASGRPWVPTR